MLPVPWALNLHKAQQLWPMLTASLPGKQHISQTIINTAVGQTQKDAGTAMHLAMFSTSFFGHICLLFFMVANKFWDMMKGDKDSFPSQLCWLTLAHLSNVSAAAE